MFSAAERSKIPPHASDAVLRMAADQVPLDEWRNFVLDNIKIPDSVLTQIDTTQDVDIKTKIFMCLEIWRNRVENQGEDAAGQLWQILGGLKSPTPPMSRSASAASFRSDSSVTGRSFL